MDDLPTPLTALVKNFDDLFSDDHELSISQMEFSPIAFDIESSDDSGLGSLDGTSFLSDVINSSSELHQPPATDSSGFLLDASSLDSSYEKSFQCGSPVVKQLSFDSLVSSPSCPDELKPRCIIFDNSFHVSSTEEDISAEIPNTCNDSGSHVAKELSFDSPVSLPSCPNELKPRCIIFDISFDVSSTEDISTEISNSCHDSGSHVAKQLSFDSPVSSPSCSTKTYQLRPRCISFDDGFDISSTSEAISVEISNSCEDDFGCASPSFNHKFQSKQHQKLPHHHDNTSASSTASHTIKTAFYKEDSTDDLIGDFNRPHSLPTVTGKHQDLKSITADTLAELLTGIQLPDIDYKIIDCRYPYEHVGGHIEGALNLHTQALLQEFLEQSAIGNTILIFHCEFSSERGPKRARFLRSLDRKMNTEHYPQLNFPEIYILDGGYKEFFYQYPDLCIPEDYIPMLHAEYKDELKKYRSSAKSWKASKKSLAAKIKFSFKY